jgi:hypothetical protein
MNAADLSMDPLILWQTTTNHRLTKKTVYTLLEIFTIPSSVSVSHNSSIKLDCHRLLVETCGRIHTLVLHKLCRRCPGRNETGAGQQSVRSQESPDGRRHHQHNHNRHVKRRRGHSAKTLRSVYRATIILQSRLFHRYNDRQQQ